jgi:hypothetical protein
MRSIIQDRAGRFAELDRAVAEEVRALTETMSQEPSPPRDSALRRLGTTLLANLASIRLSQAS